MENFKILNATKSKKFSLFLLEIWTKRSASVLSENMNYVHIEEIYMMKKYI